MATPRSKPHWQSTKKRKQLTNAVNLAIDRAETLSSSRIPNKEKGRRKTQASFFIGVAKFDWDSRFEWLIDWNGQIHPINAAVELRFVANWRELSEESDERQPCSTVFLRGVCDGFAPHGQQPSSAWGVHQDPREEEPIEPTRSAGRN